MRDAMLGFSKQFSFEPRIENAEQLVPSRRFIISGMGGSHLAADLIRSWKPSPDLIIHEDYGLPAVSRERLDGTLFIASSHSGNTEEVIDGLETALKLNLPAAVIATGGKLLEIARSRNLPFIQMPAEGIQPRSALGYSFLSLLRLLGDDEGFAEAAGLASLLNPAEFEMRGKDLARRMPGRVPLMYTSTRNAGVGYNWKIKFNETGKIPAFASVLPEANHNEMTGFDVRGDAAKFSQLFFVIMLGDTEDDPRVQKRMAVVQSLYEARSIPVLAAALDGASRLERIFRSLILADWTALATAEMYGADPNEVPMVEEFKKLIKN